MQGPLLGIAHSESHELLSDPVKEDFTVRNLPGKVVEVGVSLSVIQPVFIIAYLSHPHQSYLFTSIPPTPALYLKL